MFFSRERKVSHSLYGYFFQHVSKWSSELNTWEKENKNLIVIVVKLYRDTSFHQKFIDKKSFIAIIKWINENGNASISEYDSYRSEDIYITWSKQWVIACRRFDYLITRFRGVAVHGNSCYMAGKIPWIQNFWMENILSFRTFRQKTFCCLAGVAAFWKEK